MGRSVLDPQQDPAAVFANPVRLAIAKSCRARRRSISDLERELERPDGHLRFHVKQMLRWDVLLESANPAGRGSVYALNPDWLRALNEASVGRPVGSIAPGQRVAVLRPRTAGATARFLRAGGTVPSEWAAVLSDDEGGLLVGLKPPADVADSARLVPDFEVLLLQLGQVADADRFAELGRQLAGDA